MSAPPFVDAVHAAEMLHVPVDQVLDWIAAGKLEAFGGRPSNPFLRSAQVTALADELGVGEEAPARRIKSASTRVQQRLTADARWADVSAADIQDWVARADPARREAARKVAHETMDRLREVLQALGRDDAT